MIGVAIRLALRVLGSIGPAYRGPLLLLGPVLVMLMLPAESPRGAASVLVTLLLCLAEIRFVFDRSARGSIAVDDISFVGQGAHCRSAAVRRWVRTKAVPERLRC